MDKNKIEYRDIALEANENEDNHILEGYAIVFDEISEDMGFREKISKDLEIISDEIKLLLNHNYLYLLATTKNNTLEVKKDDKGVYFKAILPKTSYAEDVFQLVSNGYINNCSFGFLPKEEHWEDDIRIIEAMELLELTITHLPAYKQTSVIATREAEVNSEQVESTDKPADKPEIDKDEIVREVKAQIESDSLKKEICSLCNEVIQDLKKSI